MAVDVIAEAAIGRPRGEVAAFPIDAANDRRWIGALGGGHPHRRTGRRRHP